MQFGTREEYDQAMRKDKQYMGEEKNVYFSLLRWQNYKATCFTSSESIGGRKKVRKKRYEKLRLIGEWIVANMLFQLFFFILCSHAQ